MALTINEMPSVRRRLISQDLTIALQRLRACPVTLCKKAPCARAGKRPAFDSKLRPTCGGIAPKGIGLMANSPPHDPPTTMAPVNYEVGVMLARTINAYQTIVEKVETLGRLHADEALHIEFLCKHCRVTERTLRAAFRTVYATTPYHHLHALRLHQARLALLNPHAGATVTSVAMQFGFLELGRFSVEYRRAFGERPSDTLRRSSVSGVPLYAVHAASTPPAFRPPVGLAAVPLSARNANEAF